MNNVLEDCEILEIQLDLDGSKDKDINILQATLWDIEVRAFVTCRISGPTGRMMFNATAVYNAITPYTIAGSTVFVGRNVESRASMYWAEALLSAHWLKLVEIVWTVAENETPMLFKGLVNLYPSRLVNNITDLDFFKLYYYFIPVPGYYGYTWGGPDTLKLGSQYVGTGDDPGTEPHIWAQVDSLGKSMYSAVLTDLGQASAPSLSNIVDNETMLQYFSSNFSGIAWWSPIYGFHQMESQSYDNRQSGPDPTGPLGLTPSIISTNYLCQVPQQKGLGDIFISVLLADLVLLQAAWRLYTFSIYEFCLRKRPRGKYCEGCLNEVREDRESSEDEAAATKEVLKSDGLTPRLILSAERASGASSSDVKDNVHPYVASHPPWRATFFNSIPKFFISQVHRVTLTSFCSAAISPPSHRSVSEIFHVVIKLSIALLAPPIAASTGFPCSTTNNRVSPTYKVLRKKF